MHIEELQTAFETAGSELHRLILGDYQGAYSLGVSYSATTEENGILYTPCLLLRVEPENPEGFPKTVELAGHTVPLDVRGNFKPPQPQISP